MNKIILVLAIVFVQNACAQNSLPQTDTVKSIKWYHTNAFKIAAAPTVLIGYSLTVMKDNGLYSSYDARDYARKHYPNFHTEADNYLTAFPAVLMYSLDL